MWGWLLEMTIRRSQFVCPFNGMTHFPAQWTFLITLKWPFPKETCARKIILYKSGQRKRRKKSQLKSYSTATKQSRTIRQAKGQAKIKPSKTKSEQVTELTLAWIFLQLLHPHWKGVSAAIDTYYSVTELRYHHHYHLRTDADAAEGQWEIPR